MDGGALRPGDQQGAASPTAAPAAAATCDSASVDPQALASSAIESESSELPSDPVISPAFALARPVERLSPADRLRVAFGGLVLLWILGVVLFAARLVWGWRSLAALRRELKPLGDGELGDVPWRVRRTLGIDALPEMATCSRIGSPISMGIFRPVVVLPASLIEKLDGRQLHDVLVHECAHFLQRDHVVGLLQRLVQIVFWPHPMIYLLNREMAWTREEVCDNYVLRGGNVPNYARTLLALSQRPEPASLGLSAIGILEPRSRLEERVAGLLDKRRKLVTRINGLMLALVGLGFLAAVAAIAGTRLVESAPEEREEDQTHVAAELETQPEQIDPFSEPPGESLRDAKYVLPGDSPLGQAIERAKAVLTGDSIRNYALKPYIRAIAALEQIAGNAHALTDVFRKGHDLYTEELQERRQEMNWTKELQQRGLRADQTAAVLDKQQSQSKAQVKHPLVDTDRSEEAQVVLRVTKLHQGEDDDYLWPAVRVLEVFKNASDQQFGETLQIAHHSLAAEIPEGESTVYLEPCNDHPNHPWRLLRGDGQYGVSHVLAQSKPVSRGELEFVTVAGTEWSFSQKGSSNPLFIGLCVTNFGREAVVFRPTDVHLMLRSGEGQPLPVEANYDDIASLTSIEILPGQTQLLLIEDVQIVPLGEPKYLALIGKTFDGEMFELEVPRADRYGISFQYRHGEADWVTTPEIECRIVAGRKYEHAEPGEKAPTWMEEVRQQIEQALLPR